MSQTDDLLKSALEYAKRGWYVFPCKNNKAPYTDHGFKESSIDPEVIKAWWEKWPEANIGIETGVKSGIVVLDVDERNGGIESMKKVIAEEGKLEHTIKAFTANKGYHFYYKHQFDIKTTPGIRKGVDIKSDGGYVIAPPSKLDDKKRYIWCENKGPDKELIDAPGWMARVPEKIFAPIGNIISNGRRNDTLASLAGSMRRRGMSPESIYAALAEENKKCVPPLPDGEVRSISNSIGRYVPAQEAELVEDERLFWDWQEFADKSCEDIKNNIPEGICRYHIKYLEEALMGIFPAELVVIGADTGVGKTQLANDIAFHNALSKKHVYLFSLEGDVFDVSKREWHKRTVKLIREAQDHEIDLSFREFITNRDERLWKYREEAFKGLILDYKDYLHIYKRKKALDIETLSRQLAYAKDNADLIIIDHLHYFEFSTSNEHAEITEILKRIRELIAEYRIPVVLVSHLRKKTKDRFLPDNEDFHGSSNIAKQADTCIILSKFDPSGGATEHADEQIKTAIYPTAMLITKSRHERAGAFVGVVDYDGIQRKYADDYTLWGKGPFDTFKLNNYPKWAISARSENVDSRHSKQDVSPVSSDWHDKGFD